MSRKVVPVALVRFSEIVATLGVVFLAVSISAKAQTTSAQGTAQASTASTSKQPTGETFSSPQKAVDALCAAARNDDEKTMLHILGPGAGSVIFWTDSPGERKADIDLFVKNYDEMHRLVKEPDDETTLYVGAENWPFPIPLLNHGGAWYFDGALGKAEVLYRRIGANEINIIGVLHGLVDAEHEYSAQSEASGGAPVYALKLTSDQGEHNGLYWPGDQGGETSPVGPYLAQASYDRSDREPIHGYYLRILTKQAPSSFRSASVPPANGQPASGFAFLAFPAEYRSSGVKTFIVNQNNIVYEKDLGTSTTKIAAAMTTYSPDRTWRPVQEMLIH